MSKVKTRFAPSPTGRMHVGNLRTALYAYLIAKHEGGTFMLRIEDTDQERYVEGAVEIIYRTLQKTGLIHDEGPDKDGGCGPYVQSERQKAGIYMEYAKKLIEKGEAYYCFCDKERLDSLRQEVAGKEIMMYNKVFERLLPILDICAPLSIFPDDFSYGAVPAKAEYWRAVVIFVKSSIFTNSSTTVISPTPSTLLTSS